MMNKIHYKGATLIISNDGRIYSEDGDELPQKTITNRRTGYENKYRYVIFKSDTTGKQILAPVSRLVCMAFHPIPNPDNLTNELLYHNLQVDHRNDDPTDNRSSNLQWLSRKANNSKKHTRKLKSMNQKRTDHSNEYIKATNIETDEVKYYRNGMDAARGIGCSHVLIYKAIEGIITTHAKGWKVCWISRDADEVQEFKKECAIRKEQKQLEKQKEKQMAREKRREEKKAFREMVKQQAKEFRKRQLEEVKQHIRLLKSTHSEAEKMSKWEKHAILQYTLDGELVKEWRCLDVAVKETGLSGIRACLKENRKSCGGYIWKYKIPRD